jgi:ferrous iron transport protein A
MPHKMTLNDLPIGQVGRIVSIEGGGADLENKLREIGFCEGDEVELLTRGPFGGQPLAVRLSRTIIALRSDEAKSLRVEGLI